MILFDQEKRQRKDKSKNFGPSLHNLERDGKQRANPNTMVGASWWLTIELKNRKVLKIGFKLSWGRVWSRLEVEKEIIRFSRAFFGHKEAF